MAHENLVFSIILVIIIIVFLFIFLHIWEAIRPFLILAKNIIKIVDIIKNFTSNVAIILLNMIKNVTSGFHKIFDFKDIIVIALSNINTKQKDDTIDQKTLERLISEGKRIVITSIGTASDEAIKFANQLNDNLVPVSLVLFDPESTQGIKINNNIHVINIRSKKLNISSDNIKIPDDPELQIGKSDFNIIKPKSENIEDYIEAVKNGFI